MEGYLGEVRLVAYNFQPQGWMFCNGQMLAIASNTALYSLIGTVYGGDGRSTFALPNLQSRIVVHQGTGAGLSQYVIGETAGTENVTLISTQVPVHTHPYTIQVDGVPGSSSDPTNAHLAQVNNPGGSAPFDSFTTGTMSNPVNLVPQNTGLNVGGGAPHTNIQPYLVLNYIICVQGIFPSRS